MKTQRILTGKLNPAKYNPRKIDKKSFEGLKKSIQKFGYVEPIIVNKRTGLTVIGGHQRLKALIDLGVNEATCVVLDIPEIEEKALNVALNNRHTSGEYDEAGLEKILLELKDGLEEFDELNFDDLAAEFDFDLEDDPEGISSEDVIPEEPDHVVIKLGDLIELGDHRLLCGDSTVEKEVERLMGGEKASFVLSDPPYGMFLETDYSKIKGSSKSIGFKGKLLGNKYDAIKGDKEDFKPELITSLINNFDYCKEVFIFGADYFIDLLPNYGKDGCLLVWNKRSSDAQQKGIGNTFELFWSKAKHKKYVFNFEWFGFLSKDAPQEARNRIHPSMKPVGLLERIMLWFKLPVGIVADLYLGSGATLIACEKTNRKCYGMELDEKYCQVIIQRWCDYTGKTEVKINGQLVIWEDFKNE